MRGEPGPGDFWARVGRRGWQPLAPEVLNLAAMTKALLIGTRLGANAAYVLGTASLTGGGVDRISVMVGLLSQLGGFCGFSWNSDDSVATGRVDCGFFASIASYPSLPHSHAFHQLIRSWWPHGGNPDIVACTLSDGGYRQDCTPLLALGAHERYWDPTPSAEYQHVEGLLRRDYPGAFAHPGFPSRVFPPDALFGHFLQGLAQLSSRLVARTQVFPWLWETDDFDVYVAGAPNRARRALSESMFALDRSRIRSPRQLPCVSMQPGQRLFLIEHSNQQTRMQMALGSALRLVLSHKADGIVYALPTRTSCAEVVSSMLDYVPDEYLRHLACGQDLSDHYFSPPFMGCSPFTVSTAQRLDGIGHRLGRGNNLEAVATSTKVLIMEGLGTKGARDGQDRKLDLLTIHRHYMAGGYVILVDSISDDLIRDNVLGHRVGRPLNLFLNAPTGPHPCRVTLADDPTNHQEEGSVQHNPRWGTTVVPLSAPDSQEYRCSVVSDNSPQQVAAIVLREVASDPTIRRVLVLRSTVGSARDVCGPLQGLWSIIAPFQTSHNVSMPPYHGQHHPVDAEDWYDSYLRQYISSHEESVLGVAVNSGLVGSRIVDVDLLVLESMTPHLNLEALQRCRRLQAPVRVVFTVPVDGYERGLTRGIAGTGQGNHECSIYNNMLSASLLAQYLNGRTLRLPQDVPAFLTALDWNAMQGHARSLGSDWVRHFDARWQGEFSQTLTHQSRMDLLRYPQDQPNAEQSHQIRVGGAARNTDAEPTCLIWGRDTPTAFGNTAVRRSRFYPSRHPLCGKHRVRSVRVDQTGRITVIGPSGPLGSFTPMGFDLPEKM